MTVETCEKKSSEEYIPGVVDQAGTADPINTERRKIIRKFAVGTAALAGCSVLPEKWTIPVLELAALPVHATTSGDIAETAKEVADSAAKDAAAAEAAAADDAADDDLRGYSNSLTIENTGDKMSCDSIWQDSGDGQTNGQRPTANCLIVWSDGNELYVPDSTHMTMDVDQNDFRKYQPGGRYSGNNPDIPTMEVYAKRGTHPDSVTMYY